MLAPMSQKTDPGAIRSIQASESGSLVSSVCARLQLPRPWLRKRIAPCGVSTVTGCASSLSTARARAAAGRLPSRLWASRARRRGPTRRERIDLLCILLPIAEREEWRPRAIAVSWPTKPAAWWPVFSWFARTAAARRAAGSVLRGETVLLAAEIASVYNALEPEQEHPGAVSDRGGSSMNDRSPKPRRLEAAPAEL